MTRRIFRVRTLVVAIALLAVVFPIGALRYLNSSHARNTLLQMANTRIPGNIHVARHHFSWLNGRLALSDLRIETPEGETVMTAEALRVDLSIRDLLKKRILVESLHLAAPRVFLVMGAGHRLNLDAVFGRSEKPSSPAAKSPPPLVVQDFILTRGAVSFEHLPQDIQVETTGIEMKARADLESKSAALDLTIDSGTLRSSLKPVLVSGTHLKARLSGDSLHIEGLQSLANGVHLSCSGQVRSFSKTPFAENIVLRINGPIEDLPLFPKQNRAIQATGAMDFNLTASGTLDNPEAIVLMDYSGGMLGDQKTLPLKLEARLARHRIETRMQSAGEASGQMNVTGTIDLEKAFPEGFTSANRNLGRIDYRLAVDAREADLSLLPLPENAPSGIVSMTLRAQGSGVTPAGLTSRIDIAAKGRKISVAPGIQPVDLDLAVKAGVQNQRIEVQNLQGVLDTAKISGKGHLSLPERSFKGDFQLTAPDMARTLAPFGVADISGNVRIGLSASGSMERPSIDLEAAGKSLKIRQVRLGDLELSARYGPRSGIELARLFIQNRNSRIEGTGHLPAGELPWRVKPEAKGNLSLVFDTVSIADFFDSLPASGTFEGKVDLSGTLSDLTGKMLLSAREAAVMDRRLGALSTRISLNAGAVTVHTLEMDTGLSRATARGRVVLNKAQLFKLPKDPAFELDLQAPRFSLAEWFPGISGQGNLSVEARGTPSAPEASIRLEADSIRTPFQRIDAITASGTIRDRALSLAPVDATLPGGGRISAAGRIGFDGALSGTIKGEAIRLQDIDAMAHHKEMDALVSIDGRFAGTLGRPEMSARLFLSDTTVRQTPLPDTQARIDLVNGLLESNISQGQTVLQFRLEPDSSRWTAKARFRDTPLLPWLTMAGQKDLDGVLDAEMSGSGDWRLPETLNVTAGIQKLAIQRKEKNLIATRPFGFSLSDGRMSIDGFYATLLDEGYLTVKGQALFSGPVSLDAQARIPLEVLQGFMDAELQPSGLLTAAVQVTGTRQSPQVTADIGIRGGSSEIPGIVETLSELNGDLRITPDALRIQNLSGRVGDGTFQLGGDVGIKAWKPSDMALVLTLRDIPITVPDTADVLFAGMLSLNGTPETSLLEGDLRLISGSWIRDVRLNPLGAVTEKKRAGVPTPPPPERTPNPWLDPLRLDVAISRHNPFQVDNNLAKMAVVPDLRVQGHIHRPILMGRAQVEEGEITYQNKQFEIEKGVIDFTNPYRTEPTVDIEGTTQIRSWKVKLFISGPPEALDVRLSSDPHLEDQDILSLLVLGRTSQDLIRGEGGSPVSTPRLLASLMDSSYGERFRKTTGIDILEAQTLPGENADDPERVKLTIGENLTRRLTVKYATESQRGLFIQQFIAEYKFFDAFFASGYQDSSGTYGGSLSWRWEFK